jgi:hypothetical protein
VAVSAGGDHSCALDDSGVVCWGDDAAGQSTVPALANPVKISAGFQHTCALDDSGVVCWGSNNAGQVTVPSLVSPVAVSAGDYHTCALDLTGVVCWGYDNNGQSIVPPLDFDTDLDGLSDDAEDTNNNGVVDAGETDPLNHDTDGDGYSDGEEVAAGSDPLDGASTPIIADGDVTGDGVVDIRDLLRAKQILMGLYTPTQQEQDRWDVAPLVGGVPAPDGQNNAGDYNVLLQKVMGYIDF